MANEKALLSLFKFVVAILYIIHETIAYILSKILYR